MKKIIAIITASFLLSTSAYAGAMIGVKLGQGDLEGHKNSYTAGSNTYSAQTASESSEYAAIFAEVELGMVEGLSLGVEYIPFTATLGVDNLDSTDSHLELSEHTTVYALFMKDMGGSMAYVKAGYANADIGNVKANSDGTTINSHDGTLEGPMVGAGIQAEIDGGLIGRLEVTYTEYDTVSATTTSNGSSSVKKSADAELMTVSLSLAKSF
tara:strand:- start:54 stop:689 length:636 start_codon:yes stop_codon:yes gene_type:complete